MRSHGHCHAHRAQHKRNQRHQREHTGGAVQRHADRRVSLAVVRHLRFRQRRLDGRLQFRHGGIVRLGQLEKVPLAGARSGRQQMRLIQFLLRKQDARTGGKGAGEPVWLAGHRCRHAKSRVAQRDAVADVELQANQQIFAHRHIAIPDCFDQRYCRVQRYLAVVGVLSRINRFQ